MMNPAISRNWTNARTSNAALGEVALLAAALASVILWYISPAGTPAIHKVLALLLLYACAWPAFSYVLHGTVGLPVLPMICLTYGAAFSLPVFTTSPTFWLSGPGALVTPPDTFITSALVISIAGVLALQSGFRLSRWQLIRGVVPQIKLGLDPAIARPALTALGSVAIACLWAATIGRLVVTADYRALFAILFAQSSICLTVLYVFYLRGQLNSVYTLCLAGLLIGRALVGLATGSLWELFSPFVPLAAVHWQIKRTVPWRYAVVVLAVFITLQPVKSDWRWAVWLRGEAGGSVTGRLTMWAEMIAEKWTGYLAGGRETVELTARESYARVDYLHMFAHVLTVTPEAVPYKLGSTYSYLLITMVPRVVWPEKPYSTAANDDFAVTYGFLSIRAVGTTMTGVPHLVEAYINFGIVGVIGICLLIGLVYGALALALDNRLSGEGGIAILAALTLDLNATGTNTATAFGGILQHGFADYLALRILCKRS
jgi:hypothetical protein